MFQPILEAYWQLFDTEIKKPNLPLSDTKRIILWWFSNYNINKDDLPALQVHLWDTTKDETRPWSILFYQEVFIHVIYSFEESVWDYTYSWKILTVWASEKLANKIGESYTCTEFSALNPQPKTALKEGTIFWVILDPANINLQVSSDVVWIFDDTQSISVSFQNDARQGTAIGEWIVNFVVRVSTRWCY